MGKSYIKILFACLSALLVLNGCNNEDEYSGTQSQKISISTHISPYGVDGVEVGNDCNTRSSYSVSLSNKAVSGIKTSFANGDAIGVFVVTGSGKIVTSNIKCSYDGSSWSLATKIDNLTLIGNYCFFAYYPYTESMASAYSAGNTLSVSSDTDFFSSMTSNFTPAADQSSLSSFTASDLMISKGSVSDLTINFSFQHLMGLVVTKAQRYFKNADGSTYLDDTNTFSGNIPYSCDGWLLYFIKPNTNTSLGKYTYNLASGEYFQDVVNI